eukprot:CAMPEP_0172505708 /NCGR_PEP_ID=MMETSP1066-20121228/188457_1 /TAXON_ID=671091 /ORGANISM="Coscinodiscus wailesii, Strain CCMP2513" /LENGTH=292 /DNA_ID=CAMNT_0013282425 /DNA_START=156 /DNA_END=1031 /DNA_ORIENTATION=+
MPTQNQLFRICVLSCLTLFIVINQYSDPQSVARRLHRGNFSRLGRGSNRGNPRNGNRSPAPPPPPAPPRNNNAPEVTGRNNNGGGGGGGGRTGNRAGNRGNRRNGGRANPPVRPPSVYDRFGNDNNNNGWGNGNGWGDGNGDGTNGDGGGGTGGYGYSGPPVTFSPTSTYDGTFGPTEVLPQGDVAPPTTSPSDKAYYLEPVGQMLEGEVAGAGFGYSTSIIPEKVVIGAPFMDGAGGVKAGKVVIYGLANGEWKVTKHLDGPKPNDHQGMHVSLAETGDWMAASGKGHVNG